MRTPQLPDSSLPPDLAEVLREHRDRELEPEEQASEQAETEETKETKETKEAKETKETEALDEPVFEQQAEAPEDIDQQLLDQQLDLIKDLEQTPEQPTIEQVSHQAPEQAEQPAEQSSSVQPPLKQKRKGSPPIEISHLKEALEALGEKEKENPKLRLYPRKQVDFVIKVLGEQYGVKVEKKRRKTISRRIDAWRKAGPGQKPKP